MHKLIIAAVLAGVAFAGTPAMAQEAVTIKAEKSDKYGRYLTDAEGKALYMFEADTQGKDGAKAVSSCYDACATAWPPLLTDGEPKAEGKAKADKLGTVERKDGKKQVTYNGWPLYYFAKDQGPGDVKGQDIEGFGAEWYLLKPKGKKAHAKSEGKKDEKS